MSSEENKVENKDEEKKLIPYYNKINNKSIEWGIMLTLQDNLNLRIGTTTWKKYISAAFWNYISTPINFTITLFTAFSAGQSGTETIYLTKDQLFYILMVTFLLSVINTFFKLKEKAVSNYNACNQYNKFGSQFEDIYFTPIKSNDDVVKRLNKYKDLQKKMNEYNEEENVENVNYLTTLLYYSINYFFKHRMKRVNKDERFWLLDGKPNNPFYPRNRYNVDTERYFLEDFNFYEDVDHNNLYIKFNKRPKKDNPQEEHESYFRKIWPHKKEEEKKDENIGVEMTETLNKKDYPKTNRSIRATKKSSIDSDIENQNGDGEITKEQDEIDYNIGNLFIEYTPTPDIENTSTSTSASNKENKLEETQTYDIEEPAQEEKGYFSYLKSWL
jgi:hypothetical protein